MATGLLALVLAIQAVVPAPKFDAGRAREHLRQLGAIGPRPSGSPAIEQTRKYIKDQLAASGLTAVEQAWDDQTPLDKVHMVNLVATIPGARKERIVIAGHTTPSCIGSSVLSARATAARAPLFYSSSHASSRAARI